MNKESKNDWYLGKARNPFNYEIVYSGYIHNRETKERHKVEKKSAQFMCDGLNELAGLQAENNELKCELVIYARKLNSANDENKRLLEAIGDATNKKEGE